MTNATPLDDLKDRPPMQWLRERDIDLLICSELHSPGPLRELFLGGWNSSVAEFDGAWVSWHDDDGETDIVVSFKAGANELILLIEDKIDAPFQPDQPGRYRARAQRWQASLPSQSEVQTVLLAPGGYFEHEGSDLFDRQISYEDVIAALSGSGDPRTGFLAQTLKNGIESHERGYKPQPSEATTPVWRAIWDCVNSEAPKLRMKEPSSKPTRAGFIHFSAAGVSSTATQGRAKIVYKPSHENADLQFSNTQVATLENAVAGVLDSDMTIAEAGKSASIRLKVPRVDFGLPPDGQRDAIRQGVTAAERLRRLFIENRLLDLLPTA